MCTYCLKEVTSGYMLFRHAGPRAPDCPSHLLVKPVSALVQLRRNLVVVFGCGCWLLAAGCWLLRLLLLLLLLLLVVVVLCRCRCGCGGGGCCCCRCRGDV